MEILIICLAIAAVFIAPLFATRALVKHNGKRAALFLAAPLAGLSLYWAHMLNVATGLHELNYVVPLMFGAAPAGVGILIGMFAGASQRRYAMPDI